MYSVEEAKKLVEADIPGSSVKACVPFKGHYLARVEVGSAEERNFDGFYLVTSDKGDVLEFSVITDADPEEVAEAFESAGE